LFLPDMYPAKSQGYVSLDNDISVIVSGICRGNLHRHKFTLRNSVFLHRARARYIERGAAVLSILRDVYARCPCQHRGEKRTWCVRTHKRRKMRERAARRKGTRIKLRSLTASTKLRLARTRDRERERERERECRVSR